MPDPTPSSEGETLREFVVRNRDMPKDAALAQVFDMPKVRSWVGNDAARRERLMREFERLWAEVAVEQASAAPERAGAPLQRRQPSAAEPPRYRETEPVHRPHMGPAHAHADEGVVREAARPMRAVRARREKFICSACGSYDIYSESDGREVRVRCRQCKTEFPDLLELVPVVEVGPFELFFGRGREAAVKAGAIVVLWAVVYLLLRMLA